MAKAKKSPLVAGYEKECEANADLYKDGKKASLYVDLTDEGDGHTGIACGYSGKGYTLFVSIAHALFNMAKDLNISPWQAVREVSEVLCDLIEKEHTADKESEEA